MHDISCLLVIALYWNQYPNFFVFCITDYEDFKEGPKSDEFKRNKLHWSRSPDKCCDSKNDHLKMEKKQLRG